MRDIDDLEHVAENAVGEYELKAAMINLNMIETDLIQLGLVDNFMEQIISIRLKISTRLGWVTNH